MSRKHFSILAIALAVVIAAILLATPKRTSDLGDADTGPFLPALADRVNEATALEVMVAGDTTVAEIRRRDGDWTVTELQGYPADLDRVRDALAGLARAGVIEPKTGNPEYYARLGVEDVDDEDAAGVLLKVHFAEGEPVGVIVGNTAASRDGRYLRRLGDTQSVLADFDAEVPRDAIGWVDAQVADIAADGVAEVRVTHPDGETLRVWKRSADDTDFALDGGLPEGRELQSSWAMNALGDVLAGVRMEGVRPAGELDWEGAIRVDVLTFAGLQAGAEMVESEDAHWLRLSAEAPFPAPESGDAEPAEEGDVADATDATDTSDAADEAEALNARVSGWAYRISDYKAEAMNKRLEDLLKPLDDGEEDPGDSDDA